MKTINKWALKQCSFILKLLIPSGHQQKHPRSSYSSFFSHKCQPVSFQHHTLWPQHSLQLLLAEKRLYGPCVFSRDMELSELRTTGRAKFCQNSFNKWQCAQSERTGAWAPVWRKRWREPSNSASCPWLSSPGNRALQTQNNTGSLRWTRKPLWLIIHTQQTAAHHSHTANCLRTSPSLLQW